MQIKNHTLILSIALTFMFALGFYVFAWNAPASAPPGDNASAPINVGSTKQTKTGGIEMTYSILTPGSAPTGANGLMYYDSTAKKFKCYQDGNFIDCIGGGYLKIDDSATPDTNILIIANPGRTDKAARITNLLTPVNPSDAATKAYVDAQLGGGGGSGGTTGVKNLWERSFILLGTQTWDVLEKNVRKPIGILPATKTSFDIVACMETGTESSCGLIYKYNYTAESEGGFPEQIMPVPNAGNCALGALFGNDQVTANCSPDGSNPSCLRGIWGRLEIINPLTTQDISIAGKAPCSFCTPSSNNCMTLKLRGAQLDSVSGPAITAPLTLTIWYR